jgi:hypothetical protein
MWLCLTWGSSNTSPGFRTGMAQNVGAGQPLQPGGPGFAGEDLRQLVFEKVQLGGRRLQGHIECMT